MFTKIPQINASNIIGQEHIVRGLNDEINAMNWHMSEGKPYAVKPKLFEGASGTGKGHITEAYAKCFEKEQYIVFPPNGGIGDFNNLMAEVVSQAEDNQCTAIPATLFFDEFHEANATVENILKLLINKPVGCVNRNGRVYFVSQYHTVHGGGHRVFFASNELIDKAIRTRCDIYETSYYTPSQIAQHVKRFTQLPISDEAFDYVVKRLKPIGRECQNAVEKMNKLPVNKIDITAAKHVVKDVLGLSIGGIERKDRKILARLASGIATIDVLKWSAGDQEKKQTKERCDWLCHLGYIENAKHNGFGLTEKGGKYLDECKEKQAKKAAKSKGKKK